MNFWSLAVNFVICSAVSQIYTCQARQQLQDAFMAENNGGLQIKRTFTTKKDHLHEQVRESKQNYLL